MAQPFQTPQNEKSFSSLVDDVIRITGKPGSLIDIVSYANSTIRECQSFGLIARDLVEDEIISDAVNNETAFLWTRPFLFRQLRTAKYPHSGEYPKFLLPGRQQKGECEYFYAAQNYFAFAGVPNGCTVQLAYYTYLQSLLYYGQLNVATATFNGGPYDVRPAYYDIELEKWQYLNTAGTGYVDTTGNIVTDAALQKLSTNWILAEWREMVLSGTKAKVYTNAQDPRAPTEYSQYKQIQKLFIAANGLEATGF